MRRSTIVVFVGLVAAAVGWLWAQRSASDTRRAAGATPAASLAEGRRDAGAPGRAGDSAKPGAADAQAPELDLALASDAGGTLFDGGTIPELIAESPKAVKFGVVLVRYAGAQGAPPGTRSREEARKLAESLAAEAKEDFAKAVEKGDPGSTENAGRMFRGVLEPAPEFVLFSLGKGEVSEPVDTPRGFWIVKRVD